MANTWIQQGLIVVLATVIGGCSAWTGPRAKVEDRRAPGVDRSKAAASQATAGARVSQAPSRKGTKKPQREEPPTAREDPGLNAKETKEISSPGAHASADAMSGDYQILDMKPQKPSSGSFR
jgi:hypothetical protein